MDGPEVGDRHVDLPSYRGCTKEISPKLQIEHGRDMGPTQVQQSSSTTFLVGLLICLLNHLEGVSLSVISFPLALSIIPLFVQKSSYGVPPTPSVVPLVVLISTYDTVQSLSVIPTYLLVFEYGIS